MENIKLEITKLLQSYATTAYSKGSCGELGDLFMAINSDLFSDVAECFYKKFIKDLQHHKDTTVALWATDRHDLIPQGLKETIFFEITP